MISKYFFSAGCSTKRMPSNFKHQETNQTLDSEFILTSTIIIQFRTVTLMHPMVLLVWYSSSFPAHHNKNLFWSNGSCLGSRCRQVYCLQKCSEFSTYLLNRRRSRSTPGYDLTNTTQQHTTTINHLWSLLVELKLQPFTQQFPGQRPHPKPGVFWSPSIKWWTEPFRQKNSFKKSELSWVQLKIELIHN